MSATFTAGFEQRKAENQADHNRIDKMTKHPANTREGP